MKTNPEIRIATRSSPLALWQTNHVAEKLTKIGYKPIIVPLKTSGDLILDKSLHEVGGKGLFVKELEQALLDNTADIAVHSLKDLPAKLKSDFILAATLARAKPRDLLIFKKKHPIALELNDSGEITEIEFKKLNLKKIATGSPRRQLFCQSAIPNLEVELLRGNIDTRLQKLKDNQSWDAIIMAEAVNQRMPIPSDYLAIPIACDWFVPSACQGAIGIESRLKDLKLSMELQKLSCSQTYSACTLERKILERLNASCTTPIGCHVRISQNMFKISIRICNEALNSAIYHKSCTLGEIETTTQQIITELRDDTKFSKIAADLNLSL